ncbi:MAG: hypothetical protein IPG72_04760 [Ardenticatenales bacterium]|nr:hypothetical protein [Ardenticatenales bacterium]
MLFTVISSPPPIGRTSRRLIPIRVSVGLAAVAAAVMVALAPHVAHAQYCGQNDCVNFSRQVSAIDVIHYDQVGGDDVVAVEPDTGESWTITGYWDSRLLETLPCRCQTTTSSQVTVDVDWSDSTDSWSASCTGCNSSTGPIYGVTVCATYGCGSGMSIDNSWGYELVVDLAKINGVFGSISCQPQVNGYLSRVEYETTSVDDGNQIDALLCSEGTSVSPVSQTFGTTDSGAFECTYSCAGASGPQVDIIYN